MRRIALAPLLVLAISCAGVVTGGDDEAPDPGDGDLEPPDCSDLGPPMLRRLTAVQLRNTLEAVFEDAGVPDGDVLTDPFVDGFQVDATEAVIRDLDSQKLMAYAEKVASWAVANRRDVLVSCDTSDAVCRRRFITDLGAKMYREPLGEGAIDTYEALLEAEATFDAGAEAVVAAMLQSPHFLYRRELGEPDPDEPGIHRLTADELASNLSYTFTNRPPDAELVAAAREGRLSSPDDLEREARRLVAGDAAGDALSRFVRGWLEIDDLAIRAKLDAAGLLTDEVRRAMLDETDATFAGAVRSGGTVADLFTAPAGVPSPALAGYYADAVRATGILGHGSVLTRHALADSSSPVQRGKLVRERFLCEVIPPPPPDVDTDLGDPGTAVTTRQRYEQHATAPACEGCHELMDPIGFAFEHYDGFGRFRDQERGQPIDATGLLAGAPDGDVPLDGLDSLSQHLAESPPVGECLVRHLSYYAYGLEGCNQPAIVDHAAASGWALDGILIGIVRAPQFSRRKVP